MELLPNFLEESICKSFIEIYKDKVNPSVVVNENKGITKDSSRTSSSYYIPNSDPNIPELKQKVANFLNININQIEAIQFLRYLYNEKYNYHYDYLPNNPTNQRVHTILIYLNTLSKEEGGATSFYHYNKKVQPETGLAVWFRNMNEDNTLNTQSLHSGESILKPDSIKYALNIWTRQSTI